MQLTKILGTDNPAYAFTKYLDRPLLDKAMASLNLRWSTKKANSALDTMGLDQWPNGC